MPCYNAPVLIAAAACRNHPEREAIGICVKCRTRVCSECVTKVDGINYCVACLAKLAGADTADARRDAAPHSRALAVMAAAGFFVVLTLAAWALVEVALPGGG